MGHRLVEVPGPGVGLKPTVQVLFPEPVPFDFAAEPQRLGAIVLLQLPNLDRWDWCHLEPRVYLGNYSLRGRGTKGLATAIDSAPEEDLSIQFNPAIELGQTVNVVFRGFNLQSSIYQWSTELLVDGEVSVRYVRPTLRLNVYEQDPYR